MGPYAKLVQVFSAEGHEHLNNADYPERITASAERVDTAHGHFDWDDHDRGDDSAHDKAVRAAHHIVEAALRDVENPTAAGWLLISASNLLAAADLL